MVSSIPLRHSTAPGLSVTGVQLVVPDHALELPVLPALSLSTCPWRYLAPTGKAPPYHGAHRLLPIAL